MRATSAAARQHGDSSSNMGMNGATVQSAQQPINPSAGNQTNQIPVSEEQLKKLARRAESYIAIGLVVGMAALYIIGRNYWDERYYTPDEGLGYYLGMIGGIIMLLGYCYTAFKYIPALRTRAVMKQWLSIHIVFGVVGPLMVLVHSTFHIGSLNGGVALITMLLVFLSGVMGRFLYSKTHYGLGGQKARAKDLQSILQVSGAKIRSKRLDKFTESVTQPRDTFLYATWELFTFGWRSRWIYMRLADDMRHHLRVMAKDRGWDAKMTRERHRNFKRQLRFYMGVLKKVTLFRVYERFFAFWRNAHVPLLYLLLMSGVVHVVAVHMY